MCTVECSVQELFNSEQGVPQYVRSVLVGRDGVESEGSDSVTSEDDRPPVPIDISNLRKQEEKWDCESILRLVFHQKLQQ